MPSGAPTSLFGARGSRPERCGQRRRGRRRVGCGLRSAKLRASRGGRYAERADLADVSRAHRVRTSGPHPVHPGRVAGLRAAKRPPMDAAFECDVLRCAVVRRRCGPQRPTVSVSRPLPLPRPSRPGSLMSRAESNSGGLLALADESRGDGGAVVPGRRPRGAPSMCRLSPWISPASHRLVGARPVGPCRTVIAPGAPGAITA